jgi:hypothetical protein
MTAIAGSMTLDDIRPPEPCAECGRPIDPQSPRTLHEVTGWAPLKRKGGGLHSLRFKYLTGRVMCERCARVRKQTGNASQGQML